MMIMNADVPSPCETVVLFERKEFRLIVPSLAMLDGKLVSCVFQITAGWGCGGWLAIQKIMGGKRVGGWEAKVYWNTEL